MSDRPARPTPVRRGLVLGLALLVLLTLPASGCSKKRESSKKPGIDFGTTEYVNPAEAAVLTEEWGFVAPDQIALFVLEDGGRKSAEAAAEALGGTVAGEMDYVGLYLVSIPPADAAGIAAALKKAEGVKGVGSAMPNQTASLDIDVVGTECSVIGDDPAYGGANGQPYAMTGVENAWRVIRAVGIPLRGVTVGVVDSALYRAQGEFGGEVDVESTGDDDETAQADTRADGSEKPYGTHGTAVAGIIAADADNGGQTGIASVLGDKLDVIHTNVFGKRYGADTTTTADPKDPTRVTVGSDTYSLGALVALMSQVKSGATIINCSWGSSNAHPAVAAAYRRFFTKMSKDHPDVLFVCSAGNDGKALDGSRRYPSGAPLPNMITVGCVDNDGSRVSYSNQNGDDFEVTLAAPGHRVVSGVGADGAIANINGGTSFATPQVTAAAAMLRSLNPLLTAGDIKDILKETARTVFRDASGGTSHVPSSLGAGCLNIEDAVLRVVNDLRRKEGKSELTMDEVDGLYGLSLTASSEDGTDWDVAAAVRAVGDAGADLVVRLVGEGAIGGETRRHLDAPGNVRWSVTPQGAATVHVKRSDTSSCYRVALSGVEGTYIGTFAMPIEVEGGGSTSKDVPVEIAIDADGGARVSGAYKGPVALPGASGGRLLIDTDLELDGEVTGMTLNTTGNWRINSTIVIAGRSIALGTVSAPVTITGTVNAGVFRGTVSVEGTKVQVTARRR